MDAKNDKISNHCTCTFKAPGRFTFKSTAHYREIAMALSRLRLSGTETWDFIVEELWHHHKGDLVDVDGKPFRFRSDNLADRDAYDDQLREDHRRFVNRILEKARDGWTGKNRMQERMLYPMQVIYFGLRSLHCRTNGHCSRSAKDAA